MQSSQGDVCIEKEVKKKDWGTRNHNAPQTSAL